MSRYRSVADHAHPLSTGTTMLEHRVILYDAIGPGPHPCHWCGTPVDWMPGAGSGRGALIVDHLDNDGQNNTRSNLIASCHGCNIKRDDARVIRDDETFATMKGGWRRRAETRACEVCGAAFQHPISEKRPNRGRFCSMSCARRAKRAA